MRDLVALTTLPAVWSGSRPLEIAESLADILIARLQLDLVYISLTNADLGKLELIKTPTEHFSGSAVEPYSKTFMKLLRQEEVLHVQSVVDPLTGEPLYVTVIPLGHNGLDGYVLAGVHRPGDLSDLHRLLLSVAANEAVTTLRQAQLISELRSANAQQDVLLQKEQAARAEAQRATERITILQELTSQLSRSMTVSQIAHVILETGAKLFSSPRGAVYSYRDHGETIYLLDHIGLDTIQIPSRKISLLDALPVTDAIRSGNLVWIENTDAFVKRYPNMERRIRAENLQAVAVIPFLIDDQILGCLKLHFDGPRQVSGEETTLLSAIAQQCALALERAYVSEQAQVAAAVEERQRLARELHDSVSQVLFAATVSAEAAMRALERHPERVHDQLQQVVTLNRAAMGEMRTLLLELRPEALLKYGLSQLLENLVEAARGREMIEGHFEIEGVEETLPADILMALYRIAQESLNNILRHSGANWFELRLCYEPGQVSLLIRDNGCGFDPVTPAGGLGLVSMRERAQRIGAQLDIHSEPGRGTTVSCIWPARTAVTP